MEAYRGEVFGALYRVQAPAGEPGPLPTVEALVEPRVAGPGALADEWRPFLNAGAILVAGDAVAATRDGLVGVFGERLATAEPPALAGTIAAIAALEPHRAVRPHAVVPLYVRRPDAELARDRAAAERLLPHSSPS
jgi:tRNA A37 threonylcarbamoyladenosine modification protein TsaB